MSLRGVSDDEATPLYMRKTYFVYILTNKYNKVLYVGVTNSLVRRGYEHKQQLSFHNSFSKKYNLNKLVYYETFDDINLAIAREKQIKGGSRQDKINLIIKNNPEWKDLYSEVHL